MRNYQSLVGQTFGMLTVVSFAGVSRHGQKTYECVCDCGGNSLVLASNLKKGNSTSCGCKRRSSCSKRMAKLNKKHGETDTKLWTTWSGVVERTTKKWSPAYERYGGAGIGLFDDWLVYENFAKYVGPPPTDKHTIDRIDGTKGYFPGNVRWATKREQAENRKTTIYVEVDGSVMYLTQAAKHFGVSKSTASRWFRSGRLKRHEQPSKKE